MTKPEIIAKLGELNIEHDPAANKADLEALLPEAPKANKSEVTVTWNNGTRVFSKDMHGENFEDLANEFVATHADKGAEIVA